VAKAWRLAWPVHQVPVRGAGLTPAGTGGSYQYFNVARIAVGENNRLRVIFDQG